MNWQQGHGSPELTDAHRDQRFASVCLIQSNRRDTVVQIAEKVHADCDGMLSEHTHTDNQEDVQGYLGEDRIATFS